MILERICLDELNEVDDCLEPVATTVLKRKWETNYATERQYTQKPCQKTMVPKNKSGARSKGPDLGKKAFYLRWRCDVDPNRRIWSKEIVDR